MVHSAYDSFELLSNCPTKIDAVESYGSKLLLGCSDGSLKIYAPESSGSDRPPPSDYHVQAQELRNEPYALERNVSGFSKKPLVSMQVLESRELLLSLSESIAFHKLPNLETNAVITKAKGANVYSWDDRRGFLCFARQKRVCIFRHDGGRGFVEVKEYNVPDMVKSMSWCGENICLGIRKEYTILNATNGALTEVFPSGRLASPLVVSLPSGELLLGKVLFSLLAVDILLSGTGIAH
ncbi:vacuolar sorting protein 39-like [Corylus avellana]|uniref:vacuolar sorting protein 39-like n=1 Tax=Corylus avellana TaxID=13451 RepID=UPI00286BC376|nr:vacuolar sorting protein 39-like [Corylus avellana]